MWKYKHDVDKTEDTPRDLVCRDAEKAVINASNGEEKRQLYNMYITLCCTDPGVSDPLPSGIITAISLNFCLSN